MSLALKIYEAFRDDEKKAKVLYEVVDELDRRLSLMENITTNKRLDVKILELKKEIEVIEKRLSKLEPALLNGQR